MKKLCLIFLLLIVFSGFSCQSNEDNFALAKQKEKCYEIGERYKTDEEEKFGKKLDVSEYHYNQKMKTCLWHKVIITVFESGISYIDKEVIDLYSNKVIIECLGVEGQVKDDKTLTSAEFEEKRKVLFEEN